MWAPAIDRTLHDQGRATRAGKIAIIDRLPELLALLYRARTHVTTARGTLTHRQDTRLWPKVHERLRRRPGVSVQMTSSRRHGPPQPDVHEQTIRFWWAPPGRLREEVTSNIEHQSRTVVRNGELWWLYGRALEPVTNELLGEEERAHHGVGGGEHFQGLLDPSWLIPTIEIDEIRALDATLAVEARVRDDLDDMRLHRPPLVGGADRYAFAVDRHTGILRALTAFIDGEELSATRIEELALGETFDDDLFARPAGLVFAPPGGDVREVTLEEAAAQAPFTVYYLPQLPAGLWRMRVNRIRRPAFSLWLVYHRADGRESFSLGQSAEQRDAEDEHTVVLERGGTHLALRSDTLSHEALVDLAGRLRRFESPA